MTENYKKKIVVVDDHPMMLKGLVTTINTEHGLEVVARYGNAEDLLHDFNDLDLDLGIIDVSLPGMSGMELIKNLLNIQPDLKILVVSRHDENLYAERVLRSGAKGYVMKHEAGDVLIKAVRKILNGGVYVSEAVSEKLIMGMASGQKNLSHSPLDLLSDRELEVFELTGKGNSTREIAAKLHLSVKTVESYRSRIKIKLNLDNATELMMHAVKWVEGEESGM